MDFLTDDTDPNALDDDEDESNFFEIYEESPDLDIPYDLIRFYEEKEADALANKQTTANEVLQLRIKESVAKWRQHEKDVGSAEVQIVTAHERIVYLTQHLLRNKKDVSARRGLDALVVARRKFLNYLYATNQEKALKMVSELGIRFRAKGRLWDKDAKYGAFKNTKNAKIMKQLKELQKQQQLASASTA